MPETIELSVNIDRLRAQPTLPLSKSLSNRHIMLHAVSKGKIALPELSDAHDTQVLLSIIKECPVNANAGDGGTTFRFALAYLAACPGYEGILTGSERLCERPQAVLINALRDLGADIRCLEKEGFAPVAIRGCQLSGGDVEIDASISSQYASALMLVSPLMQKPLNIRFRGSAVSLSYLHKTQRLMQQCGISWELNAEHAQLTEWQWNTATLKPEADWTAASYWYAFAALARRSEIFIKNLSIQSEQGDRIVAEIFRSFGIDSHETPEGIKLVRTGNGVDFFRFDAINNPDLVQTFVVVCVGLQIPFEISGLQTLVNKETNRIEALCVEMAKLKVHIEVEGNRVMRCMNPKPDLSRTLIVETYNDHRMAMAFAPLVFKVYKLAIRNPSVVEKSYPSFWRDVREAVIQQVVWDD
jgi:3-phosphoshikimate 1-carboxyvinyltransferase